MKGFFFDNTVNLNLALFQQETDDFQTNVFTGSTFVPDNAGSILVRGIETDAIWQPMENFSINAAVTYLLDMEYDEFVNGPCPVSDISGCRFQASATSPALVPVQDLSGRRLSGAAKLQASIGAEYTMPLTDTLEMNWYGDVYHSSDRFLTTSLDPFQFQEALTLVNASVAVGNPNGDWSLRLWSRNLTDEDYIQGSFSSTLPGNVNSYPAPPRTYGATLRIRY